jgi:hypothetical protein
MTVEILPAIGRRDDFQPVRLRDAIVYRKPGVQT